MRIYQRAGYVCLAGMLGMVLLTLGCGGCRRVEQPAASTTTEPAPWTTDAPVATPQPDGDFAELPPEEISIPGPGAPLPEEPAASPVLGNLVSLNIELPAPAFRGTPVPLKEANVEKPRGKPRGPFFAPEGTVNLGRDKPVICSDPVPAAGEVDYLTDGDKEASDFGYLQLRPGTEWVQIDLGQRATVYAVLLWHNHAEARVYRDVIVLVGDDPDLLDAQTIFNNDYDNSSGLGIGTDMGYVETNEGKLVDSRGVEGRYVRLYSRGNHIDDKNHYTEVEIFGRPAM